MKNKTSRIIKYLVIIFFILLIIIIFLILFLKFKKNCKDIFEKEENNISENNIYNETIQNNELNETNTNTETSENNSIKSKLKIVTNAKTYFLVKQCMKIYYGNYAYDYYENATNTPYTSNSILDIIDKEAKDALNINENNIFNIYGDMDSPMFCIDNLYEQKLNTNQKMYLVYYRLESSSGINSLELLVKIDEKNETFSVYPHEYLRVNNFLNLKENDKITINNTEKIENKQINKYNTENLSQDSEACVKELFEKYKFDLLHDIESLYNKLDDEYRQKRFDTLEKFKQYINVNKTDLYLDSVIKYSEKRYGNYIEFIGISNRENYYIFNAQSLNNYKILLDNYTVVTDQYKELYKKSFPNIKSKYCIERFLNAINSKDYAFAYSKLLHIQKNNYYPTLGDFENYIKNNLFNKFKYECDDGITISDNMYQFNVTLYNTESENIQSKNLKMTVTLLDEEKNEFNIAFIME